MRGPEQLKQGLERFFALLERTDRSEDASVLELMDRLDELAALARHLPPSFEAGHADPPGDYAAAYRRMRSLAVARFPGLGFYNIARPISRELGEAELMAGDAHDDLADIACDLDRVAWCLANTSANDAMWHFRFSHDTHWGHHLNDLRWYLHAKSSGL